jgi:hypothetical protein
MPRVFAVVSTENDKMFWNGEFRGGLVFTHDIFRAKLFPENENMGDVVESLSPEHVRVQPWRITSDRGERTAVAETAPTTPSRVCR